MGTLKTKEEIELLERFFKDRKFAIENLIEITDKWGKRKTMFPLFAGQERFLEWKRFCVEEKGQYTLLCPKLRQGGITTLSIGDSLLDTVMKPGQDHLYLCKNGEDKESLFDRVKLMEESLPIEMRIPKLRDQSTAIKFELPHGSSVRILESGTSLSVSQKKGRSATVQYLHITEAAYIEYLSALMQGARGSVSPDGCICLESTMNGPSGYFYELCADVYDNGHQIAPHVWRKGFTILVFLPFYEHIEYQVHKPLTGELTDRERILKELGAPDSAVMYMRQELEKNVRDDKSGATPQEKFDREYPAQLMDGFRATGRSFFRLNVVQAMQMLYRNERPMEIGLDTNLNFVQASGDNRFTIFYPPDNDWEDRYMAFMDCGEGLAESDPDNTYIFDRVARSVCAIHYGRFGAFRQCEQGLKLCEYYDNAWLSWDRTGIGADRLPILLRDHGDVKLVKANPDAPDEDLKQYGVKWNADNRRQALSMVQGNVESRDWEVKDIGFWKEAEKFCYPEDGGTPRAASGFHDDRVMTLAGLAWMEARLPAPRKKQKGCTSNKPKTLLDVARFRNDSANRTQIGNY